MRTCARRARTAYPARKLEGVFKSASAVVTSTPVRPLQAFDVHTTDDYTPDMGDTADITMCNSLKQSMVCLYTLSLNICNSFKHDIVLYVTS